MDKSKIDVSAVFLGYMALIGDVEKTALAFDLTVAEVTELAESEGWQDKIRRVSIMSKSGKPGDWERAQNRALSFVQAYQIRQLVDRWSKYLLGMSADDLVTRTGTVDRNGGFHISAKIVTDLTTAAEACHRMCYNALGDTVTERTAKAAKGDGDESIGDMHSAIIAALNRPVDLPATQEVLKIESDKQIERITERIESEQEERIESEQENKQANEGK